MYDKGQGVAQDYVKALSWYLKAAEQGLSASQHRLGSMYYIGQGVPQDYAAAAKWSRQAAEQGVAGAQYNLGLMYHDGRGVPQDYVQAHKWYNLAGAGAATHDIREYAINNRDIVAAKMQPAQIPEAQRLASAWRRK
jgi:TPR repeat protein